MKFEVHPDAISKLKQLRDYGFSWHPTLRWLLILPQAIQSKQPRLSQMYVAEWIPDGVVELLRHPYKTDEYIGVKYHLFPQLFGNDEVPLEPLGPLLLQNYAEKFYERVGKSEMGCDEAADVRVREMHKTARTFVKGIYQIVPWPLWRNIRATICS